MDDSSTVKSYAITENDLLLVKRRQSGMPPTAQPCVVLDLIVCCAALLKRALELIGTRLCSRSFVVPLYRIQADR